MKHSLFYISALLTKIRLTDDDKHRLQQCFEGIRQQPEKQRDFFDYCERWKLAPWIALQLMKHEYSHYLNQDVLDRFMQAHDTVLFQNQKRNNEAVKFLSAFKKDGIDVIVLKGNVFAHTIYQDAGYKRMNDFDLLIHAQDWEKVRGIYTALNYIPLGFGWSGEKHKPTKFSHTAIPFISPDFSCIAGTQWGLKSPTTKYKVDTAKAWETAVPFHFMGLELKQLSPEFTLLHLVLHMGIYKCGTRDCMDVYNLLLNEQLDEAAFLKLVDQTGANDKALFTLALSNVCSSAVSRALLDKLNPAKKGFVVRRLASRMAMIESTGDLHHSYNDYFQDVEKNVLYFNIFHLFHQKAFFYGKILRQIFFPKIAIALMFIDRSGPSTTAANKLKARLTAPWFVFSILAQEIGRKFTLLLFLKLPLDLLLSLPNYVFRRESYFTYLKKRGVNPKDIEQSVKNVQ